MAAGRAIAVAGGAALAAYALHRSMLPEGAPDDGGYTSVGDRGGVQDHARDTERAARRRLRVPCGAARVAYSDLPMDGSVGATFAAEWACEARSLVAKYGSLTWLSIETGRPAITAECALAWIDLWLEAWWQARSEEPIRYTIGADNFELDDPYTLPEAKSVTSSILGEGGISSLGQAWRELVAARNLAVWFARDTKSADEPGRAFLHAARVADNLKAFAEALDKCATRELSGSAADEALGLAKGAARGLGSGVAWVVAEVLGPVAGAVAMTVLPYVAIGGAIYLVVRSKA